MSRIQLLFFRVLLAFVLFLDFLVELLTSSFGCGLCFAPVLVTSVSPSCNTIDFPASTPAGRTIVLVVQLAESEITRTTIVQFGIRNTMSRAAGV